MHYNCIYCLNKLCDNHNMELCTQVCTTVLVEFPTECNIKNYLILHPTHVVDARRGIRS